MKKRILITGANGQLGRQIRHLSSQYNEFDFIFTNKDDLDITNSKAVESFFSDANIYAIINCAAFTAVDGAEDNIEVCEKVNAYAVRNLVEVCEKYSVKMIHISTDYVFNGNSNRPYDESSSTNPLGIYGKSKRSGELYVINSFSDSIVIRTSWLYSNFGSNFVKTIIRIASKQKDINVVADQIGTPTSANDLANACLTILSNNDVISNNRKVYHYSNLGVASWFDFAYHIICFKDLDCMVHPISTEDYPTKVQRPYYSVLSKSNIICDFKLIVPHWIKSLDYMLFNER